MSKAARNLKTNIATAVINAVSDPKVLADVSAAPAIVEAVTKQIAPEIISATNNEPWFRSRVTWGAIASIVLPILGAFGVTADIIDADQFAAIGLAAGTVAGGLLTLYGRWKARKPIGA